VNKVAPAVTAAVIGYALGLGLAMIAFLQWRKHTRGITLSDQTAGPE
jgi:hypothetical protein